MLNCIIEWHFAERLVFLIIHPIRSLRIKFSTTIPELCLDDPLHSVPLPIKGQQCVHRPHYTDVAGYRKKASVRVGRVGVIRRTVMPGPLGIDTNERALVSENLYLYAHYVQ